MSTNLYKYCVFLSAWSVFFSGYFFRNSISPIVDVLENDLDTNATGVGTLGSFIHLFYFTPQIGYGILLQFVPGKYVLPFSSILLGVASLLFSFSTNVLYATITSAMAGLVMAPAWLCFVRIIDDLFTRAQVPFVIGVQMLLTYTGLFIANYIQARIYEEYKNWRIVFMVVCVVCWWSAICLIILIYVDYKNEKRNKKVKKNTMSMYAQELANLENGETDQTRLLSSTSSKDFSCKSKLSALKIAFKKGFFLKLNWVLSFWGYCGLSLVNGFVGLWFISYLMTKFSYSRATASLISGSFYLMRAVSAPIFGRLAMRFSRRKIFLVCGSCLWICTLLIVYVLESSESLKTMISVIILNFVSGLGAGSFGIMWCLQREYNAYYNCKDMAAGLVNTIINASGFVTQLFIGEMLDFRWERRGGVYEDGVRHYETSDYNVALLILPVIVVAGIISAMLLRETYGNNLNYREKN